jgi:hypothetical protein
MAQVKGRYCAMPKRIEELSIFGEYKQPENRLTAAFLQICKVGGEELIRHLSHLLGFELPESEVAIFSQVPGEESAPDGLLESNFAFRLFIESKVEKKAVNPKQLAGHKGQIEKETDFLVYLTPDEEKPSALSDVYWANWGRVVEELDEYIQNPKVENLELLVFLVDHFKTLVTNMNLAGGRWIPDDKQAMILAGSRAEDVALRYSHYICQNKRGFRPSKYVAFYNNSRIQYLFEIIEPPKDDVDLAHVPELGDYLQRVGQDYEPGTLAKVFKIKFLQEVGPIINDTTDRNGNPCPYTYGQPRYTTLDRLKRASRTSEL